MCPAATNLALDGESLGNRCFASGTKVTALTTFESQWRVPTNGIHSIMEEGTVFHSEFHAVKGVVVAPIIHVRRSTATIVNAGQTQRNPNSCGRQNCCL
jgi:hypothetical protein